jgi:hypothetical protein
MLVAWILRTAKPAVYERIGRAVFDETHDPIDTTV